MADANDGLRTISTGSAYAVFFGALGGLALIAIIWGLASQRINQRDPDEKLISARSTSKWWGVAASFFSSAMGSWVLSAPAEFAQETGWWGVAGYSTATAFPWLVMAIVGPRMRHLTAGRGFTSTDFVRKRFGLPLHILYTIFTMGLVFISFVVEATTVSTIFMTVAPDVNFLILTSSMAVITFSYTFLAGLKSTMLTDRIQFCLILFLICMGAYAMYGLVLPQIPREMMLEAGEGRGVGTGIIAILTINISCFFPTFMDPSSWSRMYAAETENDAKYGLFVAAAFLVVPMLFFGSIGILAEAGVRSGIINEFYYAKYSPFFLLTLFLERPVWTVMLLLFATCLSASTIDTFASGFASVIAAEIAPLKLNLNWARLASLIVFILALITAMYTPPSVLTLFMIGNLVSACLTPPLLLSLWPYTTPIGAACGIGFSVLTSLIHGWIRLRTFAGGFEWFLLPDGIYALSTLMTFIATGSVSLIVTLLVSHINFKLDSASLERQKMKFELLKGPVVSEQSSQPIVPSIQGSSNSSSSDSFRNNFRQGIQSEFIASAEV